MDIEITALTQVSSPREVKENYVDHKVFHESDGMGMWLWVDSHKESAGHFTVTGWSTDQYDNPLHIDLCKGNGDAVQTEIHKRTSL